MFHRSPPKSRRGLTLIELIVVLVILVGLAGIVIPMLPNMINRTHTATGATNIQEVAKLIQTFEALHYRYPDRWDALTDGTSATLPDYLPGSGDLTVADIGPNGLTALNGAGIYNVFPMVQKKADLNANTNDATFNPYTTGNAITMIATTKVATLNAAAILRLQLADTGTYVVLGLGSKSEMIGKGATDVPVHFTDDSTKGPADVYNRFGVIFKVNGATTMNRAQIVSVVAFHGDGLATVGDHVKEWYNIVKSSQ